VPTLPTTIFQWYVLKTSYPEIVKLLTPTSLAFKTILPATFAQFKADSHSLENLQTAILTGDKSLSEFKELLANTRYSTQQKHLLSAWLAFIFNDDKFIYLNHYGKPGTLTTIPLSQALTLTSLNPDTFTNKIVMIGQSETVDAEATQGFYNVFSDAGGDISHVEIAATAVANLITDTWLKPLTLPQQGILLLGWASLLAVLCRLLAYRPAAIALVSCSLAYLAISYYLFITAAIWLPVIIPTLLQAPLMLLGISWSRYLQTKQARKKIEQAFHYYLPKHVVKQIGNKPNEKDMKQFGELVSGVCLASDAGEYTRLSEGQHPKALNALLNRYYGVLFPEVIKQQGIISDVIGDAMMALWVQPKPGENLRVLALEAALNIKTAVDHFNALQTDQILTRIGLHYGEMRLGNVGTEDHYEYRAIGDTINTASRIEGLNKQLGTQILVSSKVIDGLSGFACREMGIFFLPGKSLPVEVFELVGRSAAIQPHTLQLIIGFNKALALFQKHQQPEALQQFLQLQKQFPSDGPIRFYIDFIKSEAKTTQVFDAIAAISVKKS
jgi:adenylate cyclase